MDEMLHAIRRRTGCHLCVIGTAVSRVADKHVACHSAPHDIHRERHDDCARVVSATPRAGTTGAAPRLQDRATRFSAKTYHTIGSTSSLPELVEVIAPSQPAGSPHAHAGPSRPSRPRRARPLHHGVSFRPGAARRCPGACAPGPRAAHVPAAAASSVWRGGAGVVLDGGAGTAGRHGARRTSPGHAGGASVPPDHPPHPCQLMHEYIEFDAPQHIHISAAAVKQVLGVCWPPCRHRAAHAPHGPGRAPLSRRRAERDLLPTGAAAAAAGGGARGCTVGCRRCV